MGSGGVLRYAYRGTIRAIRTIVPSGAPWSSSCRLSTSIASSPAGTWRPSRTSSGSPCWAHVRCPGRRRRSTHPAARGRVMVSEDRAAIRRVRDRERAAAHASAGVSARVIEAYRTHCAFCRLRHQGLLDAAHITADIEDSGEPVVSNGISLCKLHHAASTGISDRASRLHDRGPPNPSLTRRMDRCSSMASRACTNGRSTSHPKAPLQPDRYRLEERYAGFRAITLSLRGRGRAGGPDRGRPCGVE